MTSEVVVMNRLGIALASDSASTVYIGGRPKFFHADKLFMLSSHHPVGVMVYNNSSLLGVPWETILKMFRAELGTKSYSTLEEYSLQLINFLNESRNLFPDEIQNLYYINLVRTIFKGISQGINDELLAQALDSSDISGALKDVQSRVILASVEEWSNKSDAACLASSAGKDLASIHSSEIQNLILKLFPNLQTELVPSLYQLAKLVVSKDDIPPETLSGLVIAGYGESQHFPVLQEYECGQIFGGQLKYKLKQTIKIDAKTPSHIAPFAQCEIVETFLHGVSDEYEYEMINGILEMIESSGDEIVQGIPGMGQKRKEAYREKIRPAGDAAAMALVRRLRKFRDKTHLKPIVHSIEFLPKNELAHVASSLVNLSSFQKRMSISEDETVGGPVDVAVISKGDGFVWVNRKHYFSPELNRHFMHRTAKDSVTSTAGSSNEQKEG